MRRSIFILVAAGLASLVVGLTAPGDGLSGGVQLALPRRISTPYPWIPSLTQAPLRTVSVLVGTGSVSVIGDSYRKLPVIDPQTPDFPMLLSPDGTQVAYREFSTLVVQATDGSYRSEFADDGRGGIPRGWSADGTLLAVAGGTELRLLELSSGRTRAVGSLDADGGGAVAFTRAGDRLAYQVGERIVIAGTDGAQESEFTVPAGTVLAGTGAWTPDGASLLVGAAVGDGWQFRTLRVSDGSADPAPALAVLPYAVAGRALGWRSDGTLVAVAYEPAAGVRVVGLVRGEVTERSLMEVPEGVSAIDVAGQALGRSGPAVGVALWPVEPWWLMRVVFVVLAAGGLWWLHGRGLRERLMRALDAGATRRAGKGRGPGDGGEVRVSGGEVPADARPAGPPTEIRE